jgi:hypothetical protein
MFAGGRSAVEVAGLLEVSTKSALAGDAPAGLYRSAAGPPRDRAGRGRDRAARSWLLVYQLPAYAPELNPLEKVWSTMKGSLANLAVRTATELAAAVKNASNACNTAPV